MQNWSCGYYLIFFAPFVVARSSCIRSWRPGACATGACGWRCGAAAVVVASGRGRSWRCTSKRSACTASSGRSAKCCRFSADVYSYFTAPESAATVGSRFCGRIREAGRRAVSWVCAVVLLAGCRWSRGPAKAEPYDAACGRTPIASDSQWLAARLVIASLHRSFSLPASSASSSTGGFVTSIAGIPIRATNAATRLSTGSHSLAASGICSRSPGAATACARRVSSPLRLAFVLLVLAIWLSLGPLPQSRASAAQGLGLYGVLLRLRARLRRPARAGALRDDRRAVSVDRCAGYGVAALAAPTRRARSSSLASVAASFLIEAAFAPMPRQSDVGRRRRAAAGARRTRAHARPRSIGSSPHLPDGTVVAEFPFGDPAWELRYVYYSTVHWKRLVNGYSGGFPRGYKVRVARCCSAWRRSAGRRVAGARDAGTTHVIVHEAALPPDEVQVLTTGSTRAEPAWLQRFDQRCAVRPAANACREPSVVPRDILYADAR